MCRQNKGDFGTSMSLSCQTMLDNFANFTRKILTSNDIDLYWLEYQILLIKNTTLYSTYTLLMCLTYILYTL